MATKYLHTLNGRPAWYVPGEQIVYANLNKRVPLADSLAQIHQEQRDTSEWRRMKNYRDTQHEYGYNLIET